MKLKLIFFFIVSLLSTLSAQVPVMSSIIGPSSVCAVFTGYSYTATASNSPSSFTWAVTPTIGVVIATPNNSTTSMVFPQSNVIYTLICIASNISGVSSGALNYTVQVNELPVPSVSGNFTYCNNSNTSISITTPTINALPPLNYLWQPTLGVSSSTQANVTISNSVSTQYTVNVNKGMCASQVTINLVTLPSPTLNYSGQTYLGTNYIVTCSKSVVTLTVGGANSYTWYPAAATGSIYTFTVTNQPSVSVIGSGTNGCLTSTYTMLSINDYVVGMMVIPQDTLICAGSTETINVISQLGPAQISINGVVTPSIIISPTATTIYTICSGPEGTSVYMPNSSHIYCHSCRTLTKKVVNCDYLFEAHVLMGDIKIYPNPAKDLLYVEVSHAERSRNVTSETSLSLTNALGQVLREEVLRQAQQPIEINVKDLQEGIYFIQIKSEGKILVNKKFVIER
jgi:hypothetical protein